MNFAHALADPRYVARFLRRYRGAVRSLQYRQRIAHNYQERQHWDYETERAYSMFWRGW